MKTTFKKLSIRWLLLVFLAFGVLPMAWFPAFSQVNNPVLSACTNLPTWPTLTLTNGAAVVFSPQSTTTNYIPLYVNSGLAVQSTFAIPNGLQTTNALGNQQLWFWPSVDGTNALSGPPWAILAAAANFTNPVVIQTNWTQLQLNGYKGLFYTVSNGCSLPLIVGGTQTNVYPWGTNYAPCGVLFSRPMRP